jgi:hypothetical protein
MVILKEKLDCRTSSSLAKSRGHCSVNNVLGLWGTHRKLPNKAKVVFGKLHEDTTL